MRHHYKKLRTANLGERPGTTCTNLSFDLNITTVRSKGVFPYKARRGSLHYVPNEVCSCFNQKCERGLILCVLSLSLDFPSPFIVFCWTHTIFFKRKPNMVRIHSAVEKRANNYARSYSRDYFKSFVCIFVINLYNCSG